MDFLGGNLMVNVTTYDLVKAMFIYILEFIAGHKSLGRYLFPCILTLEILFKA